MPPLEYQSLTLPFKAVALQCLDEDQRPIKNAYASGFIRREGEQHFLYTCWHVVTGYDRNDIRIGPKLPGRMFLHVELQAVDRRQPGVETIGGRQSLVIPPLRQN
jgi:hypothetical protein